MSLTLEVRTTLKARDYARRPILAKMNSRTTSPAEMRHLEKFLRRQKFELKQRLGRVNARAEQN